MTVIFDLPAQEQGLFIGETCQSIGVLHPADEAAAVQGVPDFAHFQVHPHGKPRGLGVATVHRIAADETKQDARWAVFRNDVHLKAKADGMIRQ